MSKIRAFGTLCLVFGTLGVIWVGMKVLGWRDPFEEYAEMEDPDARPVGEVAYFPVVESAPAAARRADLGRAPSAVASTPGLDRWQARGVVDPFLASAERLR